MFTISRYRLRQLIREIELQKMRVKSLIMTRGKKLGLLESEERLEDLYLLLLALYTNQPIKVTEEVEESDKDETYSREGNTSVLATG
jgi:hypothetical protein